MTKQSNYFSGRAILPVLLVIVACNDGTDNSNTSTIKTVGTDSVKVFLLQTDTVHKTLVLPGELLSNQDAQIRAKVPGYIRKMNADIGSKVTKGQLLALIDAPEIGSRIQELSQKVKAAHARYLSSKDYYERIFDASRSEGVIAAGELERVKNQMMADSLDYNAAAFAAASTRQQGDYLAIVAPYAGIVTKRNIVIGSYVGGVGDKPLFELSDNSLLRLRVAVPEIYTNASLQDGAGELTTRSLPDLKFRAALVRKSGSIDANSRSETWEFEIPNPGNVLKPGSYADVKLQFRRQGVDFVVPVSAVMTTLEKRFVTRVVGGRVSWVDIRSGFSMGDKQEIFGELHPGDTLILKGSEELKPGTKVISTIFKPASQ